MRRSLNRRCDVLLRELRLSDDVGSIAQVVARVAERRGRPIELRAVSLAPGGPTGAWLATDAADYVLYQSATTERHQDQIIAHELGHITCGHRPSPSALLGPSLLASATVQLMMARDLYPSVEEREAERMADLLVAYIDRAQEMTTTDGALESVLRHRPKRHP